MRDAALIVHFLGLILGTGAGFASIFIGASNKQLPKEELPKFMLKLRALGYMGLSGIILLIVSGLYLATPFWAGITAMPLFIAKLTLVVILLGLSLLMDRQWRKAIKNGGGPDLALIPKLGRLALPIGILILLLAVLQFH